jgi:hypothetical protein
MWFGYKGILFLLQAFIKGVEENRSCRPDVYYTVPVPPSPGGQWNHGLGGIFLGSVFESKGVISKYCGIRTLHLQLCQVFNFQRMLR